MFGYTFFTTFITASLLGILLMSVYEYCSGGAFWTIITKILFFYIVGANLAGPMMNLTIFTLAFRKFGVAIDNVNDMISQSSFRMVIPGLNVFRRSSPSVRISRTKKMQWNLRM